MPGAVLPDPKLLDVFARTVGEDQIVDEFFISFTHTTVVDWLLPNLAPTGKKVELAVAVIVGFKDGKISHECISWDHTAVLTQIGLVGPEGPPLAGMGRAKKAANADSVPKLANPKLPSRAF